jgi:excisionase family DNA binding protein
MTNSARGPAALQGPRLAPPTPLAPRGVHAAPGCSPYSVREAAALLGVSRDAIEANYAQLEGVRVGRRILIPRRAVDRLVWGPPDGPHGRDAEDGLDEDATPVIERVLALLSLLGRDERVQVAQAALATAREA